MRLQGTLEARGLVIANSGGRNIRSELEAASEAMWSKIPALDGYLLMKNSPSCGLFRVKVYKDTGEPYMQKSRGVFADALVNRFPNLPIEESGRLNDANLRENHILRVYAHHRFRCQVMASLTASKLQLFHSQYKYILMAHHQSEYKALSRLLGQPLTAPIEQVAELYFSRFMVAISKPATRRNHVNVVQHLMGYVKKEVEAQTRNDLVDVIRRYENGEVNLATPLTLLYHYLKRHGSDYVQDQRYLEPYPAALGLNSCI